jgi:Ferritin-like domain
MEELARDPASRRRFLRTVGGAGAGSFAVFLSACGSKKTQPTPGGSNPNTAAGSGTDQFGKGDLGIAIFALTLEYLEVDFYAGAAASGVLSGRPATLIRSFGAIERQHVAALEAFVRHLGGTPPKRLTASFSFTSPATILDTAASLEYVGAGAYLAQADRIQSQALLAAALSIHSVEGRHHAALNLHLGRDISPDGAFAKPQYAGDVLQAIRQFTVGPGG